MLIICIKCGIMIAATKRGTFDGWIHHTDSALRHGVRSLLGHGAHYGPTPRRDVCQPLVAADSPRLGARYAPTDQRFLSLGCEANLKRYGVRPQGRTPFLCLWATPLNRLRFTTPRILVECSPERRVHNATLPCSERGHLPAPNGPFPGPSLQTVRSTLGSTVAGY